MARLDVELVSRGLCPTREQAKRLILAGEVLLAGHVCDKASTKVSDDAVISVKERPKYVGRGGLKLEGALDEFGIDVAGRAGIDIGASTGGFTDCLLQGGARHVWCFDVGTNQLAWKIRSDDRVTARERFNARHLSPEDVPEPAGILVIDVSFISLTKILPAAFGVLAEDGDLVCLIKPQFEVGRDQVGKGGIVRDPELRDSAVAKIRSFVEDDLGKCWQRHAPSAITGTDGNQEYLAWLTHR